MVSTSFVFISFKLFSNTSIILSPNIFIIRKIERIISSSDCSTSKQNDWRQFHFFAKTKKDENWWNFFSNQRKHFHPESIEFSFQWFHLESNIIEFFDDLSSCNITKSLPIDSECDITFCWRFSFCFRRIDFDEQSKWFSFHSDEYVWHANRPVNMILASGVQLPNVLTESIDVKHLSNDEFFSDLIENLIEKYSRRNPSDLNLTLKQIDEVQQDSSSNRLESMNGFQTLVYLVQQRHLGKLNRIFLNVKSNRHFDPYDLISVEQNQVRFSIDSSFDKFLVNLNLDRPRKSFRFFCFWNFKCSIEWRRCRILRFSRMVSTRQIVEFHTTNSFFSKLFHSKNISKVRFSSIEQSNENEFQF